ncbi:hypothetical protein B0H16DRAFT_1811220 [Mycena metata]|uniref:Uncharacterized protein n=1 Tax=Mycena metata TaxID=1033252 RepID=A0AAD7JBP3_9AGAR|nr:hypothetical protein B0H16DRAFT_1811220 [Mycena metata]
MTARRKRRRADLIRQSSFTTTCLRHPSPPRASGGLLPTFGVSVTTPSLANTVSVSVSRSGSRWIPVVRTKAPCMQHVCNTRIRASTAPSSAVPLHTEPLSRSQPARPARCHFPLRQRQHRPAPQSVRPAASDSQSTPCPPLVGPPRAATSQLRPLGLSSARRLFAMPAAQDPRAALQHPHATRQPSLRTPAPTSTLPTLPHVSTRAFTFRPSPRRTQGDPDKMTMEMVSIGTKSGACFPFLRVALLH